MKKLGTLGTALLAICAGAILAFGYTKCTEFNSGFKTGKEVRSGLGSEILFMPTPGGLLEVSKFQVTEQFDKKFVYTVLGQTVGTTFAHIRVPATYRYHIELAPQWEVIRIGEVFKVITPPVKPSLPVAVDLAKMQRDSGGTWVLVPFNSRADQEALEREITAKLAEKAASPVYQDLQRKLARQTVTEFVEKWLIQQESWKVANQPRIKLEFGA